MESVAQWARKVQKEKQDMTLNEEADDKWMFLKPFKADRRDKKILNRREELYKI